MAGGKPPEIDTQMPDRQILLHILSHVEAMWAELEEYRPLLAMVKGRGGPGGPNMLDVMQARRDIKRARRGP